MPDDLNRALNSDQRVCTPEQCRQDCGNSTKRMGGCRYPKPHEIEIDRLRAELEALKANESAGVMCDACGISLNTARAGNAIEAAGEHGGHVMCGACRSAAKLQAEVEALRAGISWARGLCSDEMPCQEIDAYLGEVLNGDSR